MTVRNDPRSPAKASDVRAQSELQRKLYEGVREAWDGYQQVAGVRASIAEIIKGKPGAAVEAAASELDTKLSRLGGTSGGGRRFGGGGGAPGATPVPPTFTLVHGSLLRLMGELGSGDMAPNQPTMDSFHAAELGLSMVATAWNEFVAKDLVAFNSLLMKNGLKGVAGPSKLLDVPVRVPPVKVKTKARGAA